MYAHMMGKMGVRGLLRVCVKRMVKLPIVLNTRTWRTAVLEVHCSTVYYWHHQYAWVRPVWVVPGTAVTGTLALPGTSFLYSFFGTSINVVVQILGGCAQCNCSNVARFAALISAWFVLHQLPAAFCDEATTHSLLTSLQATMIKKGKLNSNSLSTSVLLFLFTNQPQTFAFAVANTINKL